MSEYKVGTILKYEYDVSGCVICRIVNDKCIINGRALNYGYRILILESINAEYKRNNFIKDSIIEYGYNSVFFNHSIDITLQYKIERCLKV
jgi:hypothetical protein